MNRGLVIAALLGLAGYIGWQNRYIFGAPATGEAREGFDFFGELESMAAWFGVRSVANLGRVERGLLNNRNVQAMLRVIRQGESSQTEAAYRTIVGGKLFASFADHPRIFGVRNSTAAGAYQITKTTWDWIKGPMKLSDFTPANQDFAALGLMAYRGALKDVMEGNLALAIPKLRKEWTSLPGASESNQTMEKVKSVFVAYGGQSLGQVYA